jgi:benzoate-CoA ligase family protein
VAGGETFNAGAYLLDRRLQQGDGERVALHTPTGRVNYLQLDSLTRRVTAGLRALGLHRDDRVVLVMSDSVEMVAAILGAFRAGLVAVPVSTMLGGAELASIVADSGARALIATAEFAAAVQVAVDAADELEHLVLVGGEVQVPVHVRRQSWAVLVSGAGSEEVGNDGVAATTDDSWALWLYTSGTTGKPKGAMHRHANIRHVCETYGAHTLGITADDVCFSVAKLFFAYGIGNSLFFPLAVGASAVIEPRRPSPEVVAERMAADAPTLFFGPPTFYAALVAAELPADTFASVRLATSAGEALPAVLQRRVTERYGFPILDGIGATEALHVFLSNHPDDIRPGTTGKAVPGYEVQLRDEAGAPVRRGEPGALFVKGESLAIGYWRRTDATRAVFQGEWMRTGDTYTQDADGYYVCLGRSNDLLKAGGIWVSPAEVEGRLLEHDGVAEAAVVGVADSAGLDKPVACVVRSAAGATLTADELVAWCRDGLASFKRPRAVVFVDELPKTATGKVQRYRVRERFAGMALESVNEPTQATGVPAAAQVNT